MVSQQGAQDTPVTSSLAGSHTVCVRQVRQAEICVNKT